MAQPLQLQGQHFGYWTVLGEILPDKKNNLRKNNRWWNCECDCGERRILCSSQLRGGRSQSCGCQRYDKVKLQLEGQRFGKWVVVCQSSSQDSRGRFLWDCVCDCGTKRAVRGDQLRSGVTKSCGCVKGIKPGTVFGRLTVICRTKRRTKSGSAIYKCKCECGGVKFTTAGKLGKYTNSCGCLKIENTIRQNTNRRSLPDEAYLLSPQKRNVKYLVTPYVKSLLIKNTNLTREDVPLALVEAKRVQLEIERSLKDEEY